ncbi:MAG: 5'-nucleotidase C-terminal domain-containing protein [Eubacterium sp.]|nr:5'-nucleotidase C-terminal domain-containing protein [Eubacterium sp.]
MKMKLSRFAAVFMAAALTLSSGIIPAQADTQLSPNNNAEYAKVISVIDTNDTHSTLTCEPYVAAIKASEQALYGEENVLTVSGGDILSGGALAAYYKGESVIDIMNAAQYDVAVMGNDDVTFGADQAEYLAGQASFDLISATLLRESTGDYLTGKAYTVKDCDGIKVGFFGITTSEVKDVDDVSKGDASSATTTCLAALEEAGCDVIVAVCHMGYDSFSSSLASSNTAIDLVVDGHSHEEVLDYNSTNTQALIQAGSYSSDIGLTHLYLDSNNNVVDVDCELIPAAVYDDSGNVTTAGYDSIYTADATVSALLDEWNTKLNAALGEDLATLDYDQDGERASIRAKETNLGDMLTDALVESTEGADMAIWPGCHIRASLSAGGVSILEMMDVVNESLTLYKLDLTGSQLYEIMDSALSSWTVDGSQDLSASFPQISGMYAVIDVDNSNDVTLYDSQMNLITDDATQTYTVVLDNSYIDGSKVTGITNTDYEVYMSGSYDISSLVINHLVNSSFRGYESAVGRLSATLTEAQAAQAADVVASAERETAREENAASSGTDDSSTTGETSGSTDTQTGTATDAKGDTFTRGKVTYSITNVSKKTVAVTGLTAAGKKAKKLTIPNSVKSDNGVTYTVTAIKGKALANAKKLKKLTVNAKSLKSVAKTALLKDKKLKKIIVKSKAVKKKFKNAVKKIGKKVSIIKVK